MSEIQLEPGWKKAMESWFESETFLQLRNFLLLERKQGRVFYPHGPKIFEAFNRTPFEAVKVVIIGQDPYHGPGQANGLCFSVNPGIPLPPSLQNIFKALQNDFPGYKIPVSGDLGNWADQGVLLLNATLTVRKAEAGSHQKRGWEGFTDQVISTLSNQREHLVFLLWGSFAQSKANLIDAHKHLILQAPHPSPLSAHRGFITCGHFRKTNDYLIQLGKQPIDWELVAG